MTPPRRKLFTGLGALAALVLVGAATAWACVPQPRVSANPAQGPTGTRVTVRGTTWDPNNGAVKIYWDGDFQGQAPVGTDRAFNFTLTVPANATGGGHVIKATQAGTAGSPANTTFRVTGAPTAQRPSNLQGTPQDARTDALRPAPAQAAQSRAGTPAGQAAQGAGGGPAAPAGQAGAQAPATASAPGTAPAVQPAGSEAFRPAPARQPASATAPARNNGMGWLLVPLALLALGFFAVGTGIFLTERKRVRVEA